MRPEDFDVRKLWGHNPWVVHYTPTDQIVTVPGKVSMVDGGEMPYNRRAGFRTKREALEWVRDELPKLLATPTP